MWQIKNVGFSQVYTIFCQTFVDDFHSLSKRLDCSWPGPDTWHQVSLITRVKLLISKFTWSWFQATAEFYIEISSYPTLTQFDKVLRILNSVMVLGSVLKMSKYTAASPNNLMDRPHQNILTWKCCLMLWWWHEIKQRKFTMFYCCSLNMNENHSNSSIKSAILYV